MVGRANTPARYLRPKMHPIFFMSDNWVVVAVNVYQNALLVAIKTHAYVKEMGGARARLATFSEETLFGMQGCSATYPNLSTKSSAHNREYITFS